jgi:hypothetical protein
MPTPRAAKQFHALCHEHHIEMRMTEVDIQTDGPPTRISAYACPELDCAIHYTPSKGYFVVGKCGQVELDMAPRVKCYRDGQPMYLAETNPEKRAFRLWQCPQCDSSRTNEEGLVSEVS